MHVHRMSLVVAALAMTAACGGGSDDSGPSAAPPQTTASATTPAPPRDYSIDELTAALPTKDDVPDAVARSGSCPDDGVELCGEPSESFERVGVSFDLAVATGAGSGSAGDAEQRAAQATVEEGAYITVSRYGTTAAAADLTASARADDEKEFGGPIDSGDEKTSFGLQEKGSGSVVDIDVDGWAGYLSARATTITNDDETQKIQNAQLLVTSGAVTVSANVVVDATDREADYAADLARTVVADYVARLG